MQVPFLVDSHTLIDIFFLTRCQVPQVGLNSLYT